MMESAAPRELVVRVVALRDMSDALIGRQVFCKLSLNHVYRKTRTLRAEEDAQGGASVQFQGETFAKWGVDSVHMLSYEDLLVVRVKSVGLFGRSLPVGAVSVALRSVSTLGTSESRAWFPLGPYERSKDVDGSICLSLYWGEPGATAGLRDDDASDAASVMSAATPRSVGKRKRLSIGAIATVKTALGRHTHKTQEMLVRSGASDRGLDLNADGVVKEGEWLDQPHHEAEERVPIVSISGHSGARTGSLLRNAESVDEALADSPLQSLVKHSRAVLQLEIIEGRGLLAADPNGLSDPYCIVRLRQAKRRTKVIKNTLTPVWNSTFVFGGDDSPKEFVSLDDTITIIVRDSDIVGFDDLGMLELPLWAIAPHSCQPIPNRRRRGQDRRPAPTGEAIDSDTSEDDGDSEQDGPRSAFGDGDDDYELGDEDEGGEEEGEEEEEEEEAGGSKDSEDEDSGSDDEDDEEEERPRRGLAPPKLPFLRNRSVEARSLNMPPRWYMLSRSPGMSTVRGEIKLRITYFAGCGTDASENTQSLKVSDSKSLSLIKRVETHVMHKRHESGQGAAHEASSRVVVPFEEQHRRYCKSETSLCVKVLQARNLISADVNGKSDPYAVVSVRKVRKQTAVQKRTLDPVWNTVFEFGGGLDYLTETDVLEIELKDRDRLLRDDDLGSIKIPLWAILASPPEPRWYALQLPEKAGQGTKKSSNLKGEVVPDLGEIQLQFSFCVHRRRKQDMLSTPRPGFSGWAAPRRLMERIAASKRAQYGLYNGKVWFYKMNIHVIAASDLPPADELGGQNSFVTVSCGLETIRTHEVKGTINPTYKHRYRFTKSSVPGARGLCRQDRLIVSVRSTLQPPRTAASTDDDGGFLDDFLNSSIDDEDTATAGGRLLGTTIIDLGFVMDKMGYIDKDGSLLQAWFRLDGVPQVAEQTKGHTRAVPRVKLGIQLVPVAETRLMLTEKLIVRVNRAKGLDHAARGGARQHVFIRARAGSTQHESSVSAMTHGHVVIHEELYFSDAELQSVEGRIRIDVCSEESGEPIGTIMYPTHGLRQAVGKAVEGWYPMKLVGDTGAPRGAAGPMAAITPQRSNFVQLSVEDAEIHLSMRLVPVMEFLEPRLGDVDIRLDKLKMDTNDFSNNLRCVFKYAGKKVLTRTFHGVVNVQFDPKRSHFRFPVRNMFSPFKFEVWNVPVTGPSGTSSRAPRLLGEASLGIHDLVEHEAAAVFAAEQIVEPVPRPRIKLLLRDSRGKKQGSLSLFMGFEEDLLNGTLSTNANPRRHKKKPFSVANLRHEANRSFALMNDAASVAGAASQVLNWGTSSSGMGGLSMLVLFCVLEFWSSRILAALPFLGIIYVLNRHHDRVYGRFAAHLLQKSGTGVNDTKARLLISVVRGRRLQAMDAGGVSDPLVNLSLWNGEGKKARVHRLGRTRTVYKSLNPEWGESPVGFKANHGASVIQWRTTGSGQGVPAFEVFVDRHTYSRTLLDAIVVGTRGLKFESAGETSQASSGVDSSKLRSFTCTLHVVPATAFSAAKAKLAASGRSGLFNSGRLASATKAIRRRASSVISGQEVPSPRGRRTSDEGPLMFSSRSSDELLSGRLRKFDSRNPDFERGESTMSASSVALQQTRLLSRSSQRMVGHDDPSTRWLPSLAWLKSSEQQGDHNDAQARSLAPVEKKVLHDLVRAGAGAAAAAAASVGVGATATALPAAVSTTTAHAHSNPVWNQKLVIGDTFLLGINDHLVIEMGCDTGGPSGSGFLAYAFVPMKAFLSGEYVNSWFSLQTLADRCAEGACGEGDKEEPCQWQVLGEILLSLRLHGKRLELDAEADDVEDGTDSALSSPAVRRRRRDDMVVTVAKEEHEPVEFWSKSTAEIVLDVFDEDDFARRDFIGRAVVPLGPLVANDLVQEQPVHECWVPLTLRFDNSLADKALFAAAQGRTLASSNMFSGSSRSTRHVASLGARLKSKLGRFSPKPRSSDSNGSSGHASPASDSGASHAASMNGDEDLKIDWSRDGPPLGEILVRTQLFLSDPAAEEAFKQAEEAKKADRGGLITQGRLVLRAMQNVQDTLFEINNAAEQLKNLFNWTHPRKTRFVLGVLTFLFVLFLLVPSRYVLLFLGIFFFTERFRPLGVVAIKLKHMVALLPTNDDLVHLYTKGPLSGPGPSKSQSRQAAAQLAQDEDGEETGAQVSRLTARQFYHGMRDRYLTNGIRTHLLNAKSREAQENRYIVSESDCKAYGHLRILQRGSRSWKRYYFAIAHEQLMYWADKEDTFVTAAQGGFGFLTEVAPVVDGSADAILLARRGIGRALLDCAFVISHPEKYKLHGAVSPKADGGPAPKPAPNVSKRIRTFIVANSPQKRDFWLRNLQTHCLTAQKIDKLL